MEKPKLQIPLMERLKGLPGIFGIRLEEKPHYETLMHEGSKEIRRYDPIVLAKTTVQGDSYEEALEEGFFRLAQYIYGGNLEQESLPMTNPVLQESHNYVPMTAPLLHQRVKENEWTMSFVLPSDLLLQDAPKPIDSQVTLEQLPQRTWAVVRYTGNNDLDKIEEKTQELLVWLIDTGNKGSVEELRVAQYDAPYVIPFLKRNEIQIPLVRAVHS